MNPDHLLLTTLGHPVLRRKTETITDFGPDLEGLARRMFEVMYEEEGVGLAAPQVGVSKRIAVLDVPVDEQQRYVGVIVNPRITASEGSQKAQEGCLSIPGLREDVVRHQWIRVEAQDLSGESFTVEGTDLLARAIQHEIDHLNGILYIDRISSLRRRLMEKKLKSIAAESGKTEAEP
jgi:peptide deformylase